MELQKVMIKIFKLGKKHFRMPSWRSLTKIARSGSGSKSVCPRYGSADQGTDPYQNVTDPQHWWKSKVLRCHGWEGYIEIFRSARFGTQHSLAYFGVPFNNTFKLGLCNLYRHSHRHPGRFYLEDRLNLAQETQLTEAIQLSIFSQLRS